MYKPCFFDAASSLDRNVVAKLFTVASSVLLSQAAVMRTATIFRQCHGMEREDWSLKKKEGLHMNVPSAGSRSIASPPALRAACSWAFVMGWRASDD